MEAELRELQQISKELDYNSKPYFNCFLNPEEDVDNELEDFEKRLNLTQEQKDIAKAQRAKSIEKIKPLIEQINAKKEEMAKVSPEKDAELYNKLEAEIRALRRQCHEVRKENMKAFEASLTDVQKKEMQKMKEEGRKRFEARHASK